MLLSSLIIALHALCSDRKILKFQNNIIKQRTKLDVRNLVIRKTLKVYEQGCLSIKAASRSIFSKARISSSTLYELAKFK